MSRLARLLCACLIALNAFVIVRAAEPRAKLEHLPLVFEENRGQLPAAFQYVLRRDGVQAWFAAGSVEFRLPTGRGASAKVRLSLPGSKAVVPSGETMLPGKSNYLLGSDASRWIRGVPQFGRVALDGIYPGVSLGFYGNGSELEHDFVVSPGGDPTRIALQFESADQVEINPQGELRIQASGAEMVLRRPIAYQLKGSVRETVEAAFTVGDDRIVRFRLGSFDRRRELVIDPVFTFSTYLAGTGSDHPLAAATDAAGNIYVTGSTMSTDFPLAHSEQPTMSGCTGYGNCGDAFVTKFNPTGTTLLFSTYLGGIWTDTGNAIALDKNGNVIVAGTGGSDFPQAGGIVPPTTCPLSGCFFLASLTPDGSTLNYSGNIGGRQSLQMPTESIAVDSAGNAYLTGNTDDSNFQLTSGTYSSTEDGYPNIDLFVLKVDSKGKLVYSTLVPGKAAQTPGSNNNQFAAGGIVVDSSGRATVTGTAGEGLPTTSGVVAGSFPNTTIYSNPTAGFVLRLNPPASALDFATYLTGTDQATSVALDGAGNYFITGASHETNLPFSPNAYQKTPGATGSCYCNAGYILKLNAQATSIIAGTYLNGKSAQAPNDAYTVFTNLVLDKNGNPYVAGATNSPDFPLMNPIVNLWVPTWENSALVLAGMSADLTTLKFGSFLSSTAGVTYGSILGGIAMDPSNELTVVGYTNANDFPTTQGSFEPDSPGSNSQHGFVSKIALEGSASGACLNRSSIDFGGVAALQSSTVVVTLTNCGASDLHVTAIHSSDPTVAASANCSGVAPGAACTINAVFTPKGPGQVTGTLSIVDDAPVSPQVLAFSGVGQAPKIVSNSGSSFDFGRLLVGTSGPATVVVINNAGNAGLTISNVSVTGSSFSLSKNECTQSLAPNGLCSVSVVFSPQSQGTLKGSLVFTSNDPVNPTYTLPLIGIGDTSYVVPTLSRINTPTVPVNSGAQKLVVTGNDFYPASVIQLNGVPLTTTFDNNNQIEAQVPASSLTVIGEIPVTVANPAPGGGSSKPLPLTPYLPVPLTVSSFLYEPGGKLFYAAIPDAAPAHADTVLAIDPTTGAIKQTIAVGKDPNQVALSADGQYLFVALADDHAIQRIKLSSLAIDATWSLPEGSFGKTHVSEMHAVPGTTSSLVAALNFDGVSPPQAGVAMFDGNGLVNYVSNDDANADIGSFTFASSGSTLYALPFPIYPHTGFFQILTVDATGVHLSNPQGTAGDPNTPGGIVTSDGTLLYTNVGGVWDPVTQTLVQSYKLPSSQPQFSAYAVVPDTAAKRTYFLDPFVAYDEAGTTAIEAFDQASNAFLNDLAFSTLPFGDQDLLVRWGTDGFAFRALSLDGFSSTKNQLVVLRTSLTGLQTQPVPTLANMYPTSATAGDKGFTLEVAGFGFDPQSVIKWNGTALPTTYVHDWELTATVSATNLANAGTVNVVVVNPVPGGGTSNAAVFAIQGPPPEVSLSSNSLDFGSVVQGVASPSKSVTLTNTGGSPLTFGGITASGDYSETNNCGASLAAGANCSIAVVFTPTTAGTRGGTLAILDDAPDAGQSVALTGIGVAPATFGTGTGGSTSATVSGSGTVNYNLTLTPAGGLTGSISLSCTGAPQNATCTVSPTAITVNGSTAVPLTVTVKTGQSQSAAVPAQARPDSASLVFAAFGLLSLPLLWGVRRRMGRLVWLVIVAGIFAATMGAISGCGGGSSGGGTTTPPPVSSTTPSGTYTLKLNAMAGSASVSESLTLTVQ